MDSLAPGLFFHAYDPDPLLGLGYQGEVLAVTRSRVRVQLFSWRTGQPADVTTFTRRFFEKHCRVFADRETWAAEGEREKAETPYWKRWNSSRKPVAGITS